MDTGAIKQLNTLVERYPALTVCQNSIAMAYTAIKESYDGGGKLLLCGNGGSCADAEHMVGELMKGFCKRRVISTELAAKLCSIDAEDGAALCANLEQGLPAIALSAHTALNTAYANDRNPDMIYAQEVLGYGRAGDVLFGITTSGNSKNVIYALETARAKGLKTIVLTGKDGGRAAKLADISIIVPSQETYQIQELHLPVYHALCLMLEDTYFQ